MTIGPTLSMYFDRPKDRHEQNDDQLAALALEPRLDPAAPAFADRVRRLAERFGADPDRLADALG